MAIQYDQRFGGCQILFVVNDIYRGCLERDDTAISLVLELLSLFSGQKRAQEVGRTGRGEDTKLM
ncbi:MAG: hypothetical protein D6735_01055 [Acidobacteria bacterium]|nr:MAG: hypothetical protein D6735_01055 [Acidobacteriota bacterium]